MSLLNLFIISILVIFIGSDLAFSFFIKKVLTPGSLLEGISKFFKDFNAKFVALIDTLFNEIKANWHEWAIIAALYFLFLGLNALLFFALVLVGYLAFRMMQDFLKI